MYDDSWLLDACPPLRFRGKPKKMAPIAKFSELNDIELEKLSIEELREAYKQLRQHHIDESMSLYDKLLTARAESR